LVEGKPQTFKELANAAERIGLAEGGLNEGLRHGGCLETPAGNFCFELLFLSSCQVSGIAAIREVTEAVESFFSKRLIHFRMVDGSRSRSAATSSTDLPSSSQSKAR